MEQAKLARLKERLLQEKRDIEHRLAENDEYNMNDSMSGSIQELSMYDNHPADIGSEMFEREKDLSLHLLDRETLREIDQALERMKQGTYGICTVTGKQIPEDRLEAIPWALTIKDAAPAPNVNLQRPVEEEFLTPPFGRTSMDERDDANFFDGEDAWQIVESWGTSSTAFSMDDNDKTDYNDMYIESDENEGYVEAVEQIGYTDMYGYHGSQSVNFMRSGTYEEYMRKHEGKGNYLDYEQYLDERAEREGREDLM